MTDKLEAKHVTRYELDKATDEWQKGCLYH
jgi:hypothetical protein